MTVLTPDKTPGHQDTKTPGANSPAHYKALVAWWLGGKPELLRFKVTVLMPDTTPGHQDTKTPGANSPAHYKALVAWWLGGLVVNLNSYQVAFN